MFIFTNKVTFKALKIFNRNSIYSFDKQETKIKTVFLTDAEN